MTHRTVATLAAVGLVAACGSGAGDDVGSGANAVVVEVIDGDTIVAEIRGRRETVRLIGIDTPETMHPDRPVECYGPEATAFADDLLPEGTPIRLERDIVGRDDYDRLLGYVHLATEGDGGSAMFVNLEIVERGFARTLSIEPNTRFARDFVEAARRAEAADRGLWAACAEPSEVDGR